MVKKLILMTCIFMGHFTFGQVIGKTTTEDYQAGFEGKESIYSIPEYNGKPIPIALLEIGVSKEVIEQYPELGDYRVGLGLTNIVIAFLEETFRFEFVETKDAIKDRMVNQYKASQKGLSTEKIELKGNIVLAKYFCYIEVYDFSISEDETINLKDGIKSNLVTRLGLQVKMVDSQSGTYMTGSGLGKSITTREVTLLNKENLDEVKFNQSSIGTATKKALESATAKVVKRMIQKQVFDK
jgi:hypothetical protein